MDGPLKDEEILVPTLMDSGISRSSLNRARNALKQGRDLHRDGAPPYLNSSEDFEVRKWLKNKINEEVNPTLDTLISYV